MFDVRKTFREVANEHIEEYDEGNEKRLTGKHEISSMNEFKFGLAFDFFLKKVLLRSQKVAIRKPCIFPGKRADKSCALLR